MSRGRLPAHWFRDAPPPPERPAPPDLKPGQLVRLTGQFLKNTGQALGEEGRRVWVVQVCECGLCAGGAHVAVEERSGRRRPFRGVSVTYRREGQEVRHIAKGNLYVYGTLDVRNST